MISAPSLSDKVSSYKADRSKSVPEPIPSQRGHMPPTRLNVARSVRVRPAPRSTVTAPLAFTDGTFEGVRIGRADVRLPEPAEEDPEHRVGVGGGADGGSRIRAHPFLVDDDRGGQ